MNGGSTLKKRDSLNFPDASTANKFTRFSKRSENAAPLLAGLFFLVPYCEFIGATIMVFAALAYSAVTGWHIGRMIKKMDQD